MKATTNAARITPIFFIDFFIYLCNVGSVNNILSSTSLTAGTTAASCATAAHLTGRSPSLKPVKPIDKMYDKIAG